MKGVLYQKMLRVRGNGPLNQYKESWRGDCAVWFSHSGETQ